MKSIKVLALAIVAALCLAAVQPASAPATALCREKVTEGGCAQPYALETTVKGKAGNASFQIGTMKVSCTGSTVTGDTAESGTEEGKALNGEVSAVTFESCHLGETPCTVTATSLPYDQAFSFGSEGNGSDTLTKPGAENPGGTINCGAFTCGYAAESVELGFQGGNPGQIVAAEEKLTKISGGPLCTGSATWSGTYVLAEPGTETYLAAKPEPPTLLCKEETSPCKNSYGLPATLEGPVGVTGVTFKWKGQVRDTCTGSTLSINAEHPGAPLVGTVEKLTLENCTCTTEIERLPYRAEFYAAPKSPHNGSLVMVSGGSGKPYIGIDCGTGKDKCTWDAFLVGAQITGGNPAQIGIAAPLFNELTGGCGTMEMSAGYSLSKPKPLWIEY